LPKSLSESLEALHKADFLEEFIGDKLLTAIKAIRKVCVDLDAFKFTIPMKSFSTLG